MNKQLMKWMPLLALAAYAASVVMINGGYFWPGIVLIGLGTYLLCAAGVYKKQKEDSDLKNHEQAEAQLL